MLAWALAPALGATAFAQSAPSPASTTKPPLSFTIRTNSTFVYPPGSTNLLLLRTNTAPFALARTSGSQTPLLKPGVYGTAPFTCIVVVPPAGVDERSLVSPQGVFPEMPTRRPDLQFIPRNSAKK
jgi:hypothetical protein